MIPYINVPEPSTSLDKKREARLIYNEWFMFYCVLQRECQFQFVYRSVRTGLERQMKILKKRYLEKMSFAQSYLPNVSFTKLLDNINELFERFYKKILILDQYVYEYNTLVTDTWEWP